MSEILREKTLLELAIERGDAEGLAGMDGSGNDWEFPQQLCSIIVTLEIEQ